MAINCRHSEHPDIKVEGEKQGLSDKKDATRNRNDNVNHKLGVPAPGNNSNVLS